MEKGGEKDNGDLYGVLGLEHECTQSELKNAYKQLALKWHPDRCSASGVEEAKKKFQTIQHAYSGKLSLRWIGLTHACSIVNLTVFVYVMCVPSLPSPVLSDANKRFLYDVGVYDSDDDHNGMGDFLNEMATMMSQTKPNEKGEESFEELQQLFEEMFQADIGSAGSTSQTAPGCSASSTYATYSDSSTEINFGKSEDTSDFNSSYQNFCLGTGGAPSRSREGKGNNRRRNLRMKR
ncbi:dnaJ homolog subfamily B member 6-like isoform X1 [Abrus precatorius]|uniref:DnaJ homolog subfamily B member 6-like isoform X1 n=1 Tax=Abrus precatorius TaxID=3816 RepID=A0A8B8L5U4_ABRPR|nr:dnaJ homolog subfamily B member 6-like isoform X1 [Abrus precatorius]